MGVSFRFYSFLVGTIIFVQTTITSCHEDETYRFYLINDEFFTSDTVDYYNEGIIFRSNRPYNECHEELYYLDSVQPGHSYYCSCGWEDD